MSRQLAAVFRTGVGIDVSKQMIATARLLNADLEFVVNQGPDLGFTPDVSVDFVYSHMVLQDVAPFDREGALRRVSKEAGASPTLSRFYFVRRLQSR